MPTIVKKVDLEKNMAKYLEGIIKTLTFASLFKESTDDWIMV